MTNQMIKIPKIPDKYEIIPIHSSDISSFLQCRRRWDWTSPARNSLRRKVSLFGVDPNLWFGTGIHYALEQYYKPGSLQRDPVEAFSTWFELQWNGGVITEDELELTYDLEPVKLTWDDPGSNPIKFVKDGQVNQFKVQGLRDLLPNPFEEEFVALKELGIGMMTFYKDYAGREDDFECVAAESSFSVPLGFERIDMREQSPNHGKKLEVHLRGKRDAIIFYPERKDLRKQWEIHDYKTASKVDEDYFLKLENDAQCTTYALASMKEAEANDLPWTNISGVLYTALRKVYPIPPNITTRGFPSLDRQKESTTAQMFSDTVKDLGLVDWFHNDEKAQGYYNYLLAAGDKVFVQRDHAERNPHQIKVAFEELRMVAREMLDPNLHIYKHPQGSFSCTRCSFRAPCLAMDDGSDWKGMLVDGFELNRGR